MMCRVTCRASDKAHTSQRALINLRVLSRRHLAPEQQNSNCPAASPGEAWHTALVRTCQDEVLHACGGFSAFLLDAKVMACQAAPHTSLDKLVAAAFSLHHNTQVMSCQCLTMPSVMSCQGAKLVVLRLTLLLLAPADGPCLEMPTTLRKVLPHPASRSMLCCSCQWWCPRAPA